MSIPTYLGLAVCSKCCLGCKLYVWMTWIAVAVAVATVVIALTERVSTLDRSNLDYCADSAPCKDSVVWTPKPLGFHVGSRRIGCLNT